jgi:uroporphyrin-III C-methyltransferase
LQLPLTDRKSASKLIFATGHHAAGTDEKAIWSGPLPEDATLVVYMPGRDTARMARELREAGVAADMPCAAVSHAATSRQSVAACRLESFADLECGPAPVLLLVGRAMESLLDADKEEQATALTQSSQSFDAELREV